MRRLGAVAVAVSVACVTPALAQARLTAGGATVTFPLGTPRSMAGVKHGRHGDPTLMLFVYTFDKTKIAPEDMAAFETDIAGLTQAETWSAADEATQQGFSFTTAPFPDRLAASVWAETCMPPTKERPFVCRPIKVGGAAGREYLFSGPDPTRPGERPYLVQQVVVRKDRLYLLTYSGAEDASRPPAKHPSTREQKAFLRSLRFDGR